MKDNWKETWANNKDALQPHYQLPKGHEDRFLKKLNQHKNKEKKSINLWKYAAVITPIFMLSIYFVLESREMEQNNPIEVREYSADLGEATDHFSYIISEKVKEVKAQKTPENAQMIDKSLNELKSLQENYNKLLLDLKESGGNPQVIKSIMLNLNLQIKILESVLNQIEFKQELKQHPNENIY